MLNALFWITTILIIIVAAFLLFWRFCFLRNPARRISEGNNLVSPADGKIVSITQFNKKKLKFEKGLFGQITTLTKDVASEGYIISIFMNIFNVHYQRAPISGVVTKTEHSKGKFVMALKLKKFIQNEKNEITIKNGQLKIRVVQVAGFVARRIKCFVKKNQKIKKGQLIGLINLGSHVVLIIPKLKLEVKEGEKVKAGETRIAKL